MGSEFSAAAYTVLEVEAMLAAGVKGIKTIKRGTWDFVNTSNKVITTGATVDVDKTIVILNSNIGGMVSGLTFGSSEYGLVYQSVLNSITDTTITITPCYAQVGTGTNRVYGKVSWQLIEFY